MTLKVALIGATGSVGSRILAELAARGHSTLAIARHVDSLPARPLVTPRQVDGTQSDLTDALRGQEAIISAARFVDLNPDLLVSAILSSGVKRYIVAGGAGILVNKDGIRVADAPELPEPARPNSRRGIYLFELLRKTTGLEWTYVAPSLAIEDGARTGTFRLGHDRLLYDSNGRSHISYQDLAMAIVDELESPEHSRPLFTVGY